MRHLPILLTLFTLPFTLAAQDSALDKIGGEPNPLKRFDQAIAYAETSMVKAREVVNQAGTLAELKLALSGVQEGLDLALRSLKKTGRPPRKLSKQYKKGEVKSREILRRLEQLAPAISVDSREPAEAAIAKVGKLHEEFLQGVMSRK